MRKLVFLTVLLLVSGIVVTTVNAGNPLITCTAVNGLHQSGPASFSVRVPEGSRFTVTATGDSADMTLNVIGHGSHSTSVPGSLSFDGAGSDPGAIFDIIISFNGQGSFQLSFACGKAPAKGGSSEPEAGPPCDNLFDGRINNNQALDCGAPIAIYLHSIDIYGIDPVSGDGTLVMSINADVLKGTKPESNTLLSEGTNIVTGKILQVYWLVASNEIEVITEYADAKPYIVVWPVDHPDRLYHLAA